jgi:hypothetical protein
MKLRVFYLKALFQHRTNIIWRSYDRDQKTNLY